MATQKDSEKEGKGRSGDQLDSRQDLIDFVEKYVSLLENTSGGTEEARNLKYRQVKLAMKYSFALLSPSNLVLSLIERDDKMQKVGDGSTWPDGLRKRVISAAKDMKCTPQEAIVTILSENIGKYAPKEADDEEEESEEDAKSREVWGLGPI
jgi:hypothetical protein